MYGDAINIGVGEVECLTKQNGSIGTFFKKFPAKLGSIRDGPPTAILASKNAMAYEQIPCSTEQGIFSFEQGILEVKQGIGYSDCNIWRPERIDV